MPQKRPAVGGEARKRASFLATRAMSQSPCLHETLADCRDNHEKLAQRVSYGVYRMEKAVLNRAAFSFSDLIKIFFLDDWA